MIGLGVRFPVLSADEGKAHQSILTDVGVVDLGGESQSGRLKWIFPGEIDPQTEGLEAIGKLVLIREKRLSSVLKVQLPERCFPQSLDLAFLPFPIPGSCVASALFPGRYKRLPVALGIRWRTESQKSTVSENLT